MKATSLTTITALVLIGAGGFMAGRISSPEPSDTEREGPVETKSSRSSSASGTDGSMTAALKSKKAGRPESITRNASSTSVDGLVRLESIIRGENSLDRSRALLAFIDQLGPDDFQEAVAHFRSLGLTEDRFGEYGMLLSAWAEVDPTAALAYASENTRGGFATSTILTTWATVDPDAAIRWAENNHEGDDANPYLAGIIRSLAATDPTRATSLLTGMPRSTERGEALDAMLPQLIQQGSEATREWIAGLTDDSLRNGAISRAAEELAVTDPAGTAAWLLANPGEATQRQMDDVYSAWARQDPSAAVASFSALPSGEERSNALRGLVSTVAGDDPGAAISMMDRFPNDVTDRVVQNFVWHSFGTDPSVALGQIGRIADERERDQTYGRTIAYWMRQDSEAANAWIQSNPVSPEVQKEIDSRANRRR